MDINLIDIVKQQLGGSFLEKTAALLDENKASTQSALDVILPSVLGGMSNQVATLNGANLMTELFNAGKNDGSIFNMVSTLLAGGSATQGLFDAGESIVNQLFGNKVAAIVDWVGSHAGIKSSSASSLMNIAAPLLMGAIGKTIGGSTTSGPLVGLLGSQIPFLKNAIPPALLGLLGLNNLKLDTPSVSTPENATEGLSFGRILPWIILLAAGLLGFNYLKSCNTIAPEPPSAVMIPEASMMDTSAMKMEKTITLPQGQVITVAEGSFLDQLNTEITDNTLDPAKALTFDNVNFATGKTDLTDSSKVQLDDLVKIMQAYPNVVIKIDGHTDNDGNEAANVKLSLGRADAVKAYLASHGIDAKRVSTDGFGSSKPVADNNTPEGKAKNRRIEAFVVKK